MAKPQRAGLAMAALVTSNAGTQSQERARSTREPRERTSPARPETAASASHLAPVAQGSRDSARERSSGRALNENRHMFSRTSPHAAKSESAIAARDAVGARGERAANHAHKNAVYAGMNAATSATLTRSSAAVIVARQALAEGPKIA